MTEKIFLETDGPKGVITLNNPAKLNCMGYEMLEALEQSLIEVAKQEELRVLLLRGAGDRAFSTGADLKEFTSLGEEESERWIRYGHAIFNRLESMTIPTVALINGYAVGGGLELALCCDFRLGTDSAVLASPELQHGWLPGWGGMARLRRLIGEAGAKQVVMLNEKIPAHEAIRMGLITKILGNDDQEKELGKILNHLASLNRVAFGLAKRALMDESKGTGDPDIDFDVQALDQVQNKTER